MHGQGALGPRGGGVRADGAAALAPGGRGGPLPALGAPFPLRIILRNEACKTPPPPSIEASRTRTNRRKRESSRPRRRPLFYHRSSRAPEAARRRTAPLRRRRTRGVSLWVRAAAGRLTRDRMHSSASAARRLQRALSATRGRMRCVWPFVRFVQAFLCILGSASNKLVACTALPSRPRMVKSFCTENQPPGAARITLPTPIARWRSAKPQQSCAQDA